MKSRLVFLLFFLIALMFTSIKPAQADGIIIPDPTPCPFGKCPPPPVCDPGPCIIPPRPHPISQLDIRYHHVTVKINDQIAVTHIDQVFFNPNNWSIEGEYVFPLPKDAAVSNFTLWIDGKPVEGKVLNADQARQTYEDIVRQMRDPALLEYTGRGAVTAHIFPIPSQGERRIELEYSQALVADNGLVNYLYPLSTEKFSSAPIDSVTVSLDINSKQPVRAIYSPSHSVSIDRISDTHVTVSYEASKVIPDTDFSLFYSIGEAEAFHLISYRDPKDPVDPDGFFMLLLAPKTGEDVKPVAKDVLLVLDRSGSMDGEKFTQAQSALRFILKHLNPDDRFYLLTFSSDIKVYTQGLSPANAADDAINWASQLGASGSTDINRALLESAAVADRERLFNFHDRWPANSGGYRFEPDSEEFR
jgi:Ca-activated chloride channel family protein